MALLVAPVGSVFVALARRSPVCNRCTSPSYDLVRRWFGPARAHRIERGEPSFGLLVDGKGGTFKRRGRPDAEHHCSLPPTRTRSPASVAKLVEENIAPKTEEELLVHLYTMKKRQDTNS